MLLYPEMSKSSSTKRISSAERKTLREFLVELGIRAEARSITLASAVTYFDSVLESAPEELCFYTAAGACLTIAAKVQDDQRIKVKGIVAASYRILHPEEPPLSMGEFEMELRNSIYTMEHIVLRYLGFHLETNLPHFELSLRVIQMRDLYPRLLSLDTDSGRRFSAAIATLLNDACLKPSIFTRHSSLTFSIVIMALALKFINSGLPDSEWLSIMDPEFEVERLDKLKARFISSIYDMRCPSRPKSRSRHHRSDGERSTSRHRR